MDKVSRGHYSSVDGAIRAHRARNAERDSRVQERLAMVKSLNNQFFPNTGIAQNSSAGAQDTFQTQGLQQAPVVTQSQIQSSQIQENIAIPQAKQFNPVEMDEIYSEASLASASDSAFGIVQKELGNTPRPASDLDVGVVESEVVNPEEGPVEDMPKGSYVDYQV